MSGVQVVVCAVAIGLVGGLIISSWWSALPVFVAVLIALVTRDAIEQPNLRPGASEDTTVTRSVLWAIYSLALMLSAFVGSALNKSAM
jgi:hypothetical protein